MSISAETLSKIETALHDAPYGEVKAVFTALHNVNLHAALPVVPALPEDFAKHNSVGLAKAAAHILETPKRRGRPAKNAAQPAPAVGDDEAARLKRNAYAREYRQKRKALEAAAAQTAPTLPTPPRVPFTMPGANAQ